MCAWDGQLVGRSVGWLGWEALGRGDDLCCLVPCIESSIQSATVAAAYWKAPPRIRHTIDWASSSASTSPFIHTRGRRPSLPQPLAHTCSMLWIEQLPPSHHRPIDRSITQGTKKRAYRRSRHPSGSASLLPCCCLLCLECLMGNPCVYVPVAVSWCDDCLN